MKNNWYKRGLCLKNRKNKITIFFFKKKKNITNKQTTNKQTNK